MTRRWVVVVVVVVLVRGITGGHVYVHKPEKKKKKGTASRNINELQPLSPYVYVHKLNKNCHRPLFHELKQQQQQHNLLMLLVHFVVVVLVRGIIGVASRNINQL
mgnify:CR=1 FL=1